MVNIAVCDDGKYAREDVTRHLLRFSIQRNLEYRVHEYDSGESLLKDGKEYDLIFMDYQFEDGRLDGIRVAQKLRDEGNDAVIIFLSNYQEKVFETFSVSAFRFLIKPINDELFDEAMDAFYKYIHRDQIIRIRVNGNTRYINVPSIFYIEGYGKKSILHFSKTNDDIECSETLSRLDEMLRDFFFFRCQKSYIVNMRHVSEYNCISATLENGCRVQISRKKSREFIDRYGEYILRKRTEIC
ncbi:MAG: LytTR family DNA-binding domain-containing protein [Lachnospiraceae bacterium]|nr:LytTR family DNA-binding domain-containing protein [Lachnospiraceae bacterium]